MLCCLLEYLLRLPKWLVVLLKVVGKLLELVVVVVVDEFFDNTGYLLLLASDEDQGSLLDL